MAKAKPKFNANFEKLGTNLKDKKTNTPIQKTVVQEEKEKVEETKFTVSIPTPLMDDVRDIGHFQKKKLKAIFVEALDAYVAKNKG